MQSLVFFQHHWEAAALGKHGKVATLVQKHTNGTVLLLHGRPMTWKTPLAHTMEAASGCPVLLRILPLQPSDE
jgi:hypothetical protein